MNGGERERDRDRQREKERERERERGRETPITARVHFTNTDVTLVSAQVTETLSSTPLCQNSTRDIFFLPDSSVHYTFCSSVDGGHLILYFPHSLEFL